MHFDALLELCFFTTGLISAVAAPEAFGLVEAFFAGAGFNAALREQPLLEQRPSITNEPHSQNSANYTTPFLISQLKGDISWKCYPSVSSFQVSYCMPSPIIPQTR